MESSTCTALLKSLPPSISVNQLHRHLHATSSSRSRSQHQFSFQLRRLFKSEFQRSLSCSSDSFTRLFVEAGRLNRHHRLSCAASVSGGSGDHSDAIILKVGGMMCEGCASSVKRILESQPQVSSATVDLAAEIATVQPVSEAIGVPNNLGETLAKHLTNCGFASNLRGDKAS